MYSGPKALESHGLGPYFDDFESDESRVIEGGFIAEDGGPSRSESGLTAVDSGHLDLDLRCLHCR